MAFGVWKRVFGKGGLSVGGRRPRAPLLPPDRHRHARGASVDGDHVHVNDLSDQTASHEWTHVSRVGRDSILSKDETSQWRASKSPSVSKRPRSQDTIVRHHTHAKTKHSASSHPSLRERLNHLCRPRCSVDVVVGGGEHPLFMLLTSLLHRGGRLAQVRAAPRPRRSSSGDDDGELLG